MAETKKPMLRRATMTETKGSWRPIATLPKNGEKFVLAQENQDGQLVMIGGIWFCSGKSILNERTDEDDKDGYIYSSLPDYYKPTHWCKV